MLGFRKRNCYCLCIWIFCFTSSDMRTERKIEIIWHKVWIPGFESFFPSECAFNFPVLSCLEQKPSLLNFLTWPSCTLEFRWCCLPNFPIWKFFSRERNELKKLPKNLLPLPLAKKERNKKYRLTVSREKNQKEKKETVHEKKFHFGAAVSLGRAYWIQNSPSISLYSSGSDSSACRLPRSIQDRQRRSYFWIHPSIPFSCILRESATATLANSVQKTQTIMAVAANAEEPF